MKQQKLHRFGNSELSYNKNAFNKNKILYRIKVNITSIKQNETTSHDYVNYSHTILFGVINNIKYIYLRRDNKKRGSIAIKIYA